MNKKYTPAEQAWVRDNSPTMSDMEACQQFNSTFGRDLSIKTFHKLRQRLGVVKPRGRPRGAKDTSKRKTKKFLSPKEERWVRDNWNKLSNREMADKLGVSISCVGHVRYNHKLKSKVGINPSKCSLNDLKSKTGLYCIVTSDGKKYICASSDMYKSAQYNLSALKRNSHCNLSLQAAFNDDYWLGVLEECDESKLLERKNFYLTRGCQYHNSNVIPEDIEYITSLHDQIINNCKESQSGCLEYQGSRDSRGYGSIKKQDNKKTREVTTHRAIYLYHNPDCIHQIVRHTCHNKICCNIEHLTHGSHRDNAEDSLAPKRDLFEQRFVDTEYDIDILMEEFNMKKGSVQGKVYEMKLLEKYPELRKR